MDIADTQLKQTERIPQIPVSDSLLLSDKPTWRNIGSMSEGEQ